MAATFLADKSALARLGEPSVERRVTPLLLAGEIATCSIVDLEALYSARNHEDFEEILELREASYEKVPVLQADFERSISVLRALSEDAQHRGVTIPDLLISAVAERAGLIVLHYDSDFDRIVSITGQKAEWVVPRGSVR